MRKIAVLRGQDFLRVGWEESNLQWTSSQSRGGVGEGNLQWTNIQFVHSYFFASLII